MRRKATWAIVLFSAGMLAWLLLTGPNEPCVPLSYGAPDRRGCTYEPDTHSNLGREAIGLIWLAGLGVLGVIWLATRPARPGARVPSDDDEGRVET